MTHLGSPAHDHIKYHCPHCLRAFDSATGLAQHAESQSVRCRIRETDQYGQFVDQLTAGMADVQGRHDDNTIRYVSSPANLGAAYDAVALQAAVEAKQDEWKIHPSVW